MGYTGSVAKLETRIDCWVSPIAPRAHIRRT